MSDSTGNTEAGNTDAFERPGRLETYFNKGKKRRKEGEPGMMKVLGVGVSIGDIEVSGFEFLGKDSKITSALRFVFQAQEILKFSVQRAMQASPSPRWLPCQGPLF